MFFRGLICILLGISIVACESKSEPPKTKAKQKGSDDLLSDVARQPTYGHQALRVLKGAHEVQQDIKKQQKEREEIKNEAD